MPNIGALLRSEIVRLSKRAVRQEIGPIKTASNSARKQLSDLRNQVQQLEKEVAALRRVQTKSIGPALSNGMRNVRVSAKGIRSLRKRLGLSAEAFGKLANVSGATIYSWEGEHSTPRAAQKIAVAALRFIGRREAKARLQSS